MTEKQYAEIIDAIDKAKHELLLKLTEIMNEPEDCISERNELSPAQPEIVRCKDCKYVGTDAACCLVCNREGMGLKPYHVYHDDFCSYAERRNDE